MSAELCRSTLRITGFGTLPQKAQTVTLRLKDVKAQVLVGDFEVA